MSSGSYRTDGTTLIGNWYEQRFRTDESPYITLKEKMRPGYGGGPIPLRIAPVPDMYVTTHSAAHAHATPAARAALAETQRLIELKKQSALVSLDAKKELVAAHAQHFPKYYGYGAVIPRHPPGRDHRILSTTTHTDYGGAYTADLSKKTEHFSVAAHAAPLPSLAQTAATAVLSSSASATSLPAFGSARGSPKGSAPVGSVGGSGGGGGATLRPGTVPAGTLRPVATLRSPLIASQINVAVDPARPMTKSVPYSLSSTAHTAVVSAVTGNAPADPAALGPAGGATQHPHKRAKAGGGGGAATFGATGERLRIAPTADPKEHTFVQRSWLYDRSVNSQFLADRKDKHAGLAAVPGAGLALGGTSFGSPPPVRTSFARKSMAWKDPTGIWSG